MGWKDGPLGSIIEEIRHPPDELGARSWAVGKLIAFVAFIAVCIAVALYGARGLNNDLSNGSAASSNATGGNVNSRAASSAATQAAPAAPQTFNGNGSENLGTIKVPTDSLLTWQCGSCTTMAIAGTTAGTEDFNEIDVISSATSGRSEVSADTYQNVQVVSDGSWTITITANG